MIKKDFIINFEKKLIYHNTLGSKKIYPVEKLYIYLQDVFDEPENMKYEIPIKAISKKDFVILNGWQVDEKTLKFLKGNIIYNS